MSDYIVSEKLKVLEKRLLKKKEEIDKEIKKLESEDPFNDPGRLTDNKPEEDALEEVGHENVVAQVNSLKATLEDINIALEKLEKGNYGVCEKCGKDIGLERLEVLPYARFCINCQRRIE